MKSVGRKFLSEYGIALAVMVCAFVVGLCRSEAVPRNARQDQEQPLEKALADISKRTGARIVVELPVRPADVTLHGDGQDALKDITEQMGFLRSDAAGITVLRPKSYPAVSQSEMAYRESVRNLMLFLHGLSAEQRKALTAGNWLDAAQFSAEEQEHMRLACYTEAPSLITSQEWDDYKAQGKIAFTFQFDPYVESVAEGDGIGTQAFFLAPLNFSDIDTFHAGKVPGTFVANKVAQD